MIMSHYFYDLTHFKRLRQKYRNVFVYSLVQMNTSKSHSENNWPLVVACYKRLRVQETTRNLRKALKGTTRLEMTGILSEVLLIPSIFRQRLMFSCMFFFADWIGVEIFSWKSRGGLATYYTESLIVVNHTNMAHHGNRVST